MSQELTVGNIKNLIKNGQKLPFATENYPSRGQTTTQELYQTEQGKFFLKRVSERNHLECQINVKSGSLAEREFWAARLARAIGFVVPELWLIDDFTTVQRWLDCPDGRTYKKSTGRMELIAQNVFECVLFDWVTGQIDRHDANYLYDFKNSLIIPVDSAHGFLKYEGSLPDYLHLFEVGNPSMLRKKIRSDVKIKLCKSEDETLRKLVPLRTEDEVKSFIVRKNSLKGVNTIQDLLDLYRRRR